MPHHAHLVQRRLPVEDDVVAVDHVPAVLAVKDTVVIAYSNVCIIDFVLSLCCCYPVLLLYGVVAVDHVPALFCSRAEHRRLPLSSNQ